MGNRSSSNKDHSHGESRGRSRSFNGLASRFRRASKSPPRDRSSSVSENARPQRKGSGKQGQNGDIGPVSRKIYDVPRVTPDKKSAAVDVNIGNADKARQDLSSRLSQSAPGSRHPLPPTPVKKELTNKEPTSPQSTLSSDSTSFIKSSNLKNLQKYQVPDKSDLIENYTNSPRLGVSQMRQVSRELFSDQLEDLAKRRAMANLNRDLSLSNASLGVLSNRSKSMHSLNSCDYDYEERCNVGELLSFEHSHKVGELCRSITSQFSETDPDEESPLLRHRTNSASAVELGRHDRKHVAMGTSAVQMRRQVPSPTKSTPTSSGEPIYSVPHSRPEPNSARRLLVSRALKDELSPGKSSLPSLSSPEPQVNNSRSSLPSLSHIASEPSMIQRTPERSSLSSLSRFSPERSTSPRTTPDRSLITAKTRSLSPTSQYRASSPLSNASHLRTSSPVSNTAQLHTSSPVSNTAQNRTSSPVPNTAQLRTSSPASNAAQNRTSSPLPNSSQFRTSSPIPNTAQFRTSSPISNTSLSDSPSKRTLINVNREQLLAANMTKSMQKFLLANPGVGTNSTDYEKLHNKIDKKKKTIVDNDMRERSSSFSVISRKMQEQQIVQQMIEEQQTEQRQKQVPVVHVQSHSYDSTPVSTGGDSGFRSRSQSWSSLSQKSMSGSKVHTLVPDVHTPMKSLWSYSVTSLAETASQPQRFISGLQDEGPLLSSLAVNQGRYYIRDVVHG